MIYRKQTGNPEVLGKGRLVPGSLDTAPVTFTGRHDVITKGDPAFCALPFLSTPCADLRTPTVLSKKTLGRNLPAQDPLRPRTISS